MPLRKNLKKVLVIGSGPIVIGQAAEFDYAGTQACLALKEEGIQVVLVNNNPATIMTDHTIADKVYIEPLTVPSLEDIIKKEMPDGIIGTLGGQTGLNLTVQLYEQKILQKYGVELLGTSVESIQNGEDREKFRNLMIEIDEPIPESKIVTSFDEGMKFAEEIGFPVIIRPAYTLGGAGGGFAYSQEELEVILKKGLNASPIHQVLVEKSIKGWKEIEYEVMRDANDTCIIVCNMENMDPVGVHTGDSIVVAPSQTLTDVQHQMLRNASLKVIRALQIIGGCNIQFALDPNSDQYYIIEVNPRVSRSSALASKATGYPIARIAAKCAIGYHLDEILNPITGNTFASFEPAIDYIVVKLPRFPFDKFSEADRSLGTQMKATGEVMAIDRSFEGALNKAIRSLEIGVCGLKINSLEAIPHNQIYTLLETATDTRLFAIAEAFWRGMSVAEIYNLTQIDQWFLEKLHRMVKLEQQLSEVPWDQLPEDLLRLAKRINISDQRLAQIFHVPEKTIRDKRKELSLKPGFKLVDTCAAEFDAVTPYYYSTWHGKDEVEKTDRKKILVIGSGPIRIGQGIEFDYCSVHATLAIKKKGYEAIVINNNPETVSTDYSIADRLYFEPLTAEDVLHVIEKEQIEGVLIQFGGQTAINLANSLQEEGVPLLGTSVEGIDALEDRKQFYQLLRKLEIPHIAGQTANKPDELIEVASLLGFPVLVRPSYVIGGQSMFIFHKVEELLHYTNRLKKQNNERIWPLLVDQYIQGLECEVDVISDGKEIIIPGIFEHIEKAGVHSGDSTAIFPPITLTSKQKEVLVDYASRIAQEVPIKGIMNIQFVIAGNTVYVLEVNPRASRTVPIISKVTDTPLIEWATAIQLGEKAANLSKETGLLEEPPFYSVKFPVFSASKLKGVDHALGPEMKSTGEVLGLGKTLDEAIKKALFFDGHLPLQAHKEKPYLLCSISDDFKAEGAGMIQKLAVTCNIIGTEGTAEFLQKHGIEAEVVSKDRIVLDELFKKGRITAVLNIPTAGRDERTVGFHIRELATRYQVPIYTSLQTFEAATGVNELIEHKARTISEYLCLRAGAAI
ncbi:carbamoyl-phosphate synthase large subunit [Bacillus oleivorans]|uniref:Carbamoyl phosphate synthase large chain n=1 Tax=Bacillus oleivorans TaxID=1448271 RepID=A0A285CLY2_9BACI|nr:carbamoyl-phosphate synthase (glutamine-hydrolyzing) large subunit [Bacillus oleivorans]SNX68046.1 carbamoyl-phosphate synthase large subunit [Bacillus oleivorans]